MKRVAIIGCGGSGKSKFAAQLGERSGLPVIHLDRLYWRPGWVPRSEKKWRDLQAALARVIVVDRDATRRARSAPPTSSRSGLGMHCLNRRRASV